MTQSDVTEADRLARRRARLAIMLAIYFVFSQSFYFGKIGDRESLGTIRDVSITHISAWFAMALAMLFLLLTGGSFLRRPALRALLEDDSTRLHRREALAAGFVATMLASVTVYIVAFFRPMSGFDSVHLIMTFGISVALLRFGRLEKRALADE